MNVQKIKNEPSKVNTYVRKRYKFNSWSYNSYKENNFGRDHAWSGHFTASFLESEPEPVSN